MQLLYSKVGGASYKHKSTGRAWFPDEQELHINILELKLIFLALKTFTRRDISDNTHIKVLFDNSTPFLVLTKWEPSICWVVIIKQ